MCRASRSRIVLRHAVRSLTRSPWLSLLCICALGLGVGANAAVFAFIDKMLLEPFAFPQERRVMLLEASPERDRRALTVALYEAWAEQTRTLEALGAYRWWETNLTGVNEPEHLIGYQVTPSLFRVLGVAPVLGRGFSDAEATPGNERVVVLSHATWQRRFGGDPGILGKPALLDGQSYAVVGVMPADFRFPKAAALWAPLLITEAQRAALASHTLYGVGLMRPRETETTVQTELSSLATRLRGRQPPGTEAAHLAQVLALRDYGDPTARYVLWLMGAGVALILFLACANVANVLLARSTARAREFAVRSALGASRGQLMAHLLAESVLLAVGACAVGLAVGWVGVRLMRAGMPASIERFVSGWERVGLDWRLVAFSGVAAALAAFLASVYSAFQISRRGPQAVLTAESAGASRERHRVRGVLIGLQICLALVLVTDAGLFAQTLRRIAQAPLGFEAPGVLTFRLGVSEASRPQDADVARFLDEGRAALAVLPGVAEVGVVSTLPLSGRWGTASFEVEGADPVPAGAATSAVVQSISPGYLEALRIQLRGGRGFTAGDHAGTQEVALVSEPLARRYFPAGDALGRRIRLGTTWRTVVGVVGAVKHSDVTDAGLALYVPVAQSSPREVAFVVRTSGDPAALGASVQRALHALAPDQPLSDLMPMPQVVADNALLTPRYATGLLGVLGAIALVLSAVGVYGVMAQWVLGRLRELGIRSALGAEAPQLLRLVLWRGLRPAAVGMAVGLVLALGQGRALRRVLYGISPDDPLTLGAVAMVIAAVSLIACVVPARRALATDPAGVLRQE